MDRGIKKSLQLFSVLVNFFGLIGISEASWGGTIGTQLTIEGTDFETGKPAKGNLTRKRKVSSGCLICSNGLLLTFNEKWY